MARPFDGISVDCHCIPTKRRRFADQSAASVPYAAAMSGSDMGTRTHAHCLDNLADAILGHANSTQLVEVRAWTR
jgi:hypothetical protein